ncbi:hypothetical protein SLEP1_g45952 [Rubroshorea leprosula]|uniref:Cytochrome P450 n=1 Tax=Rubroshorea leprosula TaxID=152421 RepID=A0AAV5LLI0_9ROSI|nr:hypothetical protein SLEP1_g45952 [Rubroshorea leprosula]
MVYTHACLYETMRLYPPVPVKGKVAMGVDVLADGTERQRTESRRRRWLRSGRERPAMVTSA